MTDNYSIFDRNVMHAYEGAAVSADSLEAGCAAYLRGRGKEERLAEEAGYEAIHLIDRLSPMISAAQRLHDNLDHGVTDFILERSFRRHFPAN